MKIALIDIDGHAKMEKEIWKPIVGMEDFYEVSNIGNVRTIERFVVYNDKFNHVHVVKQHLIKKNESHRKNVHPYAYVSLKYNGKKCIRAIHRLVAEAFIPNPNNLPQVNHKDENPFNNNVDNLEWCTAKYNLNYGTRNKRASESRGKCVLRYTLDGNFIDSFNGGREAARLMGLNPSAGVNIISCARGKRNTAYGYKWKLLDERKYSDSK